MSRDLFPIVPAIAVAMLLPRPAFAAQTSGPKAEVLATVTDALSAGMAGDMVRMRAQYAPDCVFADEFAPYVWTGPGALDRYLASGGQSYEETQHAPGKAAFGPPRYVYVTGDRAFVVEPVSGEGTVRGRPYAEEGAFAFSLVRMDDRWRITSQTWTKSSENLDPYAATPEP